MTDASNAKPRTTPNEPTQPTQAQKWPPLTVEEAAVVAALRDPVIRNLKITQGYHDLKIALTRVFGEKNVTWCAYATWASKTAGSFIRAEEVPGLVREYLARADHVTDGVARTNTELGSVHPEGEDRSLLPHRHDRGGDERRHSRHRPREHARLPGARPDLCAVARDLRAARRGVRHAGDRRVRGAAHAGPGGARGQDLLVQAFRAYYEAMYEKDDAKKAQQMFLANALVGYHEQVRLQQPIVSSLNAPLVDVFLNNAKAVAKKDLPHLLHGAVEGVVEKELRPLAKKVEEAWHEVSTRWLMTLSLPRVVLTLGKDVPGVTEAEMFPEELREATYGPLVDVLAKLDRTPNTLHGSGARDWGEVGDRMNYIVDLFRSRQQDPSLYEPPFTEEQVVMIREGVVPGGKL